MSMKTIGDQEMIYGLNVEDLQEVANQILERPLTNHEIALVGGSVGDYIDWTQAIENAIRKHIHE
jgi:hypothetical protein